jgi:hypothetical protein
MRRRARTTRLPGASAVLAIRRSSSTFGCAEDLAPLAPAITQEARQRQRELKQRLLVAERDERLRLE